MPVIICLHYVSGFIRFKLLIDGDSQGYLVGSPRTDSLIDENSKFTFAHRLSLFSDELYEIYTFILRHPHPWWSSFFLLSKLWWFYTFRAAKTSCNEATFGLLLEQLKAALKISPPKIFWSQTVTMSLLKQTRKSVDNLHERTRQTSFFHPTGFLNIGARVLSMLCPTCGQMTLQSRKLYMSER